MRVRCCQSCGQHVERVRDLSHHLSGLRLSLYRHVAESGENGIAADTLFDRIYTGRRDGGPQSGVKIIAAHAAHVNKTLAPYGQRLEGGRSGPVYTIYRLVDTFTVSRR